MDAMYSLLSGCMEDEFQQEIYENPNMSLDEMNALYRKLAEEYGAAGGIRIRRERNGC